MQRADQTTNDAGPSRQRSHHKNQLPAYCYCARCRGLVKQKPSTISDHRLRYPVENDENDGSIEKSDGNDQALSDRLGLEPSSPRRLGSPEPVDIDYLQGSSPHSPRSPHLYMPPGTPSDVQMNDIEEIENAAHLFEADAEVIQAYDFDDLLGNDRFGDDGNWDEHLAGFLGAEPGLGMEMNDPDDDLFNEDFGLPEDEGDPELQAPRFQFEAEQALDEDLQRPPDDDPDEEIPFGAEYQAFREHEHIRNAYIDAFIQKVVYGATHRALKHQLRSARRTIAGNPLVPREDINDMAQTIGTAEARLGVSTSHIITTFALCPLCKRRYTSAYIARADDSSCLNEECEGVLFTVRDLASGSRRRVPNLTYPYASPVAWLKHMLNLPGMSELIQTWRNNADNDWELSEPISSEEWMQNLDPNRPIGDISEGWGWRSTLAGLERRYNPQVGIAADENVLDRPIRFVSLPFGLSLTMNTDWFQATKEGNYSVGACYLVLNNIPRHLRFLRENIALCIVYPGPKEPSDYALEQMLEPLVNDLLELKQGIRMTIRHGDPPIYEEKLVHGELSQHIADLVARIKIGGRAGLKSELNFCLYCHCRLSSLSVQAGYMRNRFNFRDPEQEVNSAYRWRFLPSHEERRQLFEETGVRFTAFHRIPGWCASSSSPPDTMHLFYLGGMNWIVKQVLVAPGILNKRRPNDQEPQDIFNECLRTMWIPKNFERTPPKLGQTRGSIKADQWKLTSRILFVPLYLALRDGDVIGQVLAPAGNRNSPSFKHRAQRAKLLHQQRQKYYRAIGQPNLCPPIDRCFSTRNLQFHYRQVLRFCLAVNIIDKRSITAHEIAFGQELLELLCKDYLANNVPLPPNFHYMMHLEEFLLKTGSPYNTHGWSMERANRIVSQINHNGKSNGIMEGTLMRGWWSYSAIQNLINVMRSLPNRTPADDSIIEDLTAALQSGTEQAQQQGALADFIAQCQTAYTRLYGIHESTRLSKQSRVIDLGEANLYETVLRFCIELWPDAGIFGPGLVQNIYLAPVVMVRNHSYVEYNGIRYGSYLHSNGKGYCYGYIDERNPVRIERILAVEFPGEANMRCVCALVRPFQHPEVRPQFPWDTW
ncbi:Transposase family tnp2 [Ceratobasidium sp. AG-Ba]|nr:Transposase family tnp2 [Ceratobasidium sp. AG-Ba]QRW14501.1 Transposase family tnp2 [Ceratobasidium sp. AG-Ba]